jgi:iron complex transport system permease protein
MMEQRQMQQAAARWMATDRQFLKAAVSLAGVVSVLSLSLGPTGISLASLPRAMAAALEWIDDPAADRQWLVLVGIRLPRTLLGLFVGASLAIAGVILQGLFRNPLADPVLVGVSSGAALAAIATIALGNGLMAGWSRTFGVYALPLAAFTGGLSATLGLVAIASRHGRMAIGTLLLSGIAFAAIGGALSGLIAFYSDDRELRDLTLWTMGSLSGASWTKVWAVIPFVIALCLLVPRLTRALNGFVLGESEAFHLGIEIEVAKRIAIGAIAAAVGAAVAVAGLVGFVGLVVPHLVRLVAGADHRFVLPGSAIVGATLVVAADVVARLAVQPAELPLGIVMALIGAPVFLHLVLTRGAGSEA